MIYLLFRNQYFKWLYLLNNIFPSYQILYYFFNNCKMHRKKKDRERMQVIQVLILPLTLVNRK